MKASWSAMSIYTAAFLSVGVVVFNFIGSKVVISTALIEHTRRGGGLEKKRLAGLARTTHGGRVCRPL